MSENCIQSCLVIFLFLFNIALTLYFRTESRNEWRELDAKINKREKLSIFKRKI